MSRIAIVATESRLRDALVVVAGLGSVELVNPLPAAEGDAVEALRRLERARPSADATPRLDPVRRSVEELEHEGAADVLAAEVELKRRSDAAIRRGSFAALVGWAPTDALPELQRRLGDVGAAVVELSKPAWVDPPTLLEPVRAARPFRPLVETYGAAKYGDLDPTPFAAASFVLMFGMMFGDVGHGLILALLALVLRRGRGRLAGVATLWPLVFSAGIAAAFFGLLYGEGFGPTGLVPTLWLDPVDDPVRLLVAAACVGAVLLTISYAIGIVNRWREAGPFTASVAPSGIAGFAVFIGVGIVLVGVYAESTAVVVAGALAGLCGVALLAIGFLVQDEGGALAVTTTAIEVFDSVARVGTSILSFTRLAAFGLMHAALGALVFSAATALWGGVVGVILGTLVFLGGNAIAFALEGLVAGVQALRLEYYELFSRVFVGVGRTFTPWSIPVNPATRPVAVKKEAA
jgi:V/A-type H+-transporting ATPase subunit I